MIPLKQISYNNSTNSIFGQTSNTDDEKKFISHSMPDNLRLRGGAGKSSCTSIVPQTSICRQIVYTPGTSYGYQCQPFLMCGPQMPFQSCPPIILNISTCPKHASSPCCLEKTSSKVSLRKRKSSKRSSRSPKGSRKHMQTSSNHSKSSQISGASSASQGSKEIINSKEQKTDYLFDTQSTQYNSMESIHEANNSKTTKHKSPESPHGAKPGHRSLTVEPIEEIKAPPEQLKKIHYGFPLDFQHEYTAEYPSSRYSAPPAFGRSLAEPVTYPKFTSFQGNIPLKAFHQNEYDTNLPGSHLRNAPSNIPSFINPDPPSFQPDVSPDIRVDLFGAKEKSPETPKQSTPPNLTTKGNVVQTAASSSFVSPGSPQWSSSKIHERSDSHNPPAFPKQSSTDQSPKFVSLESGSILPQSPIQSSVQTAASPSFVSPGSPQWASSKIHERSDRHNSPAFSKQPSTDQSPKFVSLESGSSSPRATSQNFSSTVSEEPTDPALIADLIDMNERFQMEAKAIMDGLKAFQEARRRELL